MVVQNIFWKTKKCLAVLLSSVLAVLCAACTNSAGTGAASAVSEPAQLETLALPETFVPFVCSASDFLNWQCTADDASFSAQGNTLYLEKSGSKTAVLQFGAALTPCAYIGNALYLHSSGDLYRLVIDANGNYDSSAFSLVYDSPSIPVYLEENKMLLRVLGTQNAFWRVLDTQTGEGTVAEDYNGYVDEENTPSGIVSAEQAQQTARAEIQKEAYASVRGGYTFTTLNATVLMYKPDLTFGRQDRFWSYRNASPYCWCVCVVADNAASAPAFTCYINGDSGAVAYVAYCAD